MVNKTILLSKDLTSLMDGVWQYNGKGIVSGLIFYDEKNNVLPVSYCEILSDEPGLRLRTEPEDQALTPEQLVQRFSSMQFTDPKKVPPPMTIEQLQAISG